MKILLASKEKFLIVKGYSLLGIPRENLRIGYVDTALSIVQDQEYLTYMKEYEQEMRDNNIFFEKFDLKDKNEEQIKSFFADKNVIQFTGGNPFYLIKAIRESGFDKVLQEFLSNGLFYVGCSAGSYVMCPTVEVGGWKSSRNKYNVKDFTALGYFPFLLKCHYTDDKKEETLEKIKTASKPVRLLRDDEAFLLIDDKIEFISDREETIL